ncbi:MAG: triose-phosphate isomerase, partial [Candidatus Micrarchaeota archaeon]
IVLNLKSYKNSVGEHADKLVAAVEACKSPAVDVVVCPQAVDLRYLTGKHPEVTFFAQAVEPLEPDKNTGFVTLEAVKAAGAKGTLVNHAEHQVAFEKAAFIVDKAKRNGLKEIICAATVDEAVKLAGLKPWSVSLEPPDLIGSGVSVSSVRPELVEASVKKVKEVDAHVLALVGAGVSTPEDFAMALDLGADGVLLASAFVNAKDPAQWLKDFIAVV